MSGVREIFSRVLPGISDRTRVVRLLVIAGVVVLGLGPTGCRKAQRPARLPASSVTSVRATEYLTPEPLGRPVEGQPWIAHVSVTDLDRDGLLDVLVCDAQRNELGWLRQTAPGTFTETAIATDLRGPVHATPDDLDGDGDLDVLVASMGVVFPNNDKIGSLFLLENDGAQRFTRRTLLENVARVTDVAVADFNGDGRRDLAVAQFGYDQGEVRWMERLADGSFNSRTLLNLSGAINVCVHDMNDDGTPDIVALVSQEWEEVYLFSNDGRGGFTPKVIAGSTNEDFGSSGIGLCDLNQDGRMDVLYTNGDGFDYAQPGPRPWHGVQWLENRGGGNFSLNRIGDLPGAYSPVGVDLDRDGDIDVVAVSGFNRWTERDAVSLMWFRNDGGNGFTPHVLAHRPTHLLTATAADLDGDGQPELLTGGFHAYPPYEHMSRILWWRRARSP